MDSVPAGTFSFFRKNNTSQKNTNIPCVTDAFPKREILEKNIPCVTDSVPAGTSFLKNERFWNKNTSCVTDSFPTGFVMKNDSGSSGCM